MAEPQQDGEEVGNSAAFDATGGLGASADRPKQHHNPKPFGWNTRDLAEVDPQRLLPGRVYRSSQVFNKQAVLELRIRSAVDLRKAGRDARKSAKRGEDPQYVKPSPKKPVKTVLGLARRFRRTASKSASDQHGKAQRRSVSDASQEAAKGERHADDGAQQPAGADARPAPLPTKLPGRQGDGMAAAAVQNGESSGMAATPSATPFGHQDQQQTQHLDADDRLREQQQPDMSTASSRAAGAAASISHRRHAGGRNRKQQQGHAGGGVQHAAGEAAKLAGGAALQAGNAAERAGAAAGHAAGHAAEHVAGELMLPKDDSGFDLASGRDTLEDYGVQVYHVELIPPKVKLAIFWRVPQRVKWKTISAAISCKSPQDVMAPVVADPEALGYSKLYCLMLDKSKPYIRRALAVFAHEENLPCVVHCTHGKDRTGLLSALLLLMCGVEQDAVVQDYVHSEANLKEDRGRVQNNTGIGSTMVRNDVIASPSGTMHETLRYLHAKYGNIEGYLKAIRLPDQQKWAIRENLLQPEALRQFPRAANTATAPGGSKQLHQQFTRGRQACSLALRCSQPPVHQVPQGHH